MSLCMQTDLSRNDVNISGNNSFKTTALAAAVFLDMHVDIAYCPCKGCESNIDQFLFADNAIGFMAKRQYFSTRGRTFVVQNTT